MLLRYDSGLYTRDYWDTDTCGAVCISAEQVARELPDDVETTVDIYARNLIHAAEEHDTSVLLLRHQPDTVPSPTVMACDPTDETTLVELLNRIKRETARRLRGEEDSTARPLLLAVKKLDLTLRALSDENGRLLTETVGNTLTLPASTHMQTIVTTSRESPLELFHRQLKDKLGSVAETGRASARLTFIPRPRQTPQERQ